MQDRLFDPGPEYKGPLSTRQFLEQTQWHSTDVPDWGDEIRSAGVPVHAGTAQAAAEATPGGNRYPVRPTNVSQLNFSDERANAADRGYRVMHGLPSSTAVNDSTGGLTSDIGMAYLRKGESLSYVNDSEDAGSTSYVSPPGGYQTLRDTSDFHLMPSQREHFTPAEMRAQGLPSEGRRAERAVARDPRLIEEVPPAPFSPIVEQSQWLSGEQVQAATSAEGRPLANSIRRDARGRIPRPASPTHFVNQLLAGKGRL